MSWGKRRSTNEGRNAFPCDVCSEKMLVTEDDFLHPGVWKGSARVYHCAPPSYAFGAKYQHETPHHWIDLHGDCPNCGKSLGCFKCSGLYTELLCMACKTFIDGSKPLPREESLRRLREIIAGMRVR